MENFASLFEERSQVVEMREGEVIDAKVIAIDSKYVTVSAGLKSESVITINEFKNDSGELEVQVGDTVQVAIEAIEDGYGETRLSREKARKIAAWSELELALENQEILTGYIYGRVKGGLGVLYKNIRLFLPGSLLDVRTIRDFAQFVEKSIEFKVIKVDRRRNNIVISRKAVLLDKTVEDSKVVLERMQEGNIVKGVIKNITDYGAFVDLGGIDGLLYITDLSWKRIKHPSEVLTIGQEISAVILRFDQEKHRVSLGIKQLSNDPWESIAERYPVGMRMYGKVSNITDYGAFVELESGIEGLVHVSEMDWTNKNVNPSKILKQGDEVQVQILEIDGAKRRISLGMKQCQANPWLDFADKYKKGDHIKGTIRSITDFGLFVGLNGNIDGLVHVSDLSWSTPSDVAIRSYKKGQEIEAVIISVDVEKERIALGIKQLDSDSHGLFVGSYEKGTIIKATVKSVLADHAMLEVAPDVDAILSVREFSNEKIEDLTTILKPHQEINVVVTHVDKKQKPFVINVSVKAIEAQEQAKKDRAAGTTNFGDLLQNKLSK